MAVEKTASLCRTLSGSQICSGLMSRGLKVFNDDLASGILTVGLTVDGLLSRGVRDVVFAVGNKTPVMALDALSHKFKYHFSPTTLPANQRHCGAMLAEICK